MKPTESEILAIVDAEFESSMGSPGGQISEERARAWKYYLSKPLGNEVEGQSSVVTSDVSDVVDGIMPSLLRLFTTKENLVTFDAFGSEDKEQAEQETDYVSHTFFKKVKNGFMVLYTWFFDALLQKNGIVKAWWDESVVVTEESYEGLSFDEVVNLLQDEELEAVEQDERFAETVVDGQIVNAPVYDITFKRVCKSGRVVVENVPPEEYRISSDSRSVDPEDARMVGHEREVTRSDLVGMGFSKKLVDSLPTTTNTHNSSEDIARRDKTDDTLDGHPDKSQELVLYREAYIKLDMDGKGRSELRQVQTGGGKMLANESCDRQPFHILSPQPLPHKHFGRATAEKVMDVMDINTTILRQTLDNLYRSNQPGTAVYEGALGENTMDDLLTTAVGRVVRTSRPPAESLMPMVTPFTAGASFPMMEYFDKVKRDRTGVNADSEGLSPEQLKNIQTGVLSQATDQSKMKIEAIARIFAETGIKSLFLHIHELIQKHRDKPDHVELRGKWVDVDPTAWRDRKDMTINIGLGIGSRESNLIHLNAIWDKQRQMVDAGGMNLTVTPQNIFNTASEIVRNANLKMPELFFTDPQNEPAPPPTNEQQEFEALQLRTTETQQQIELAKLQQSETKESNRHNEEMAKLALDKEQGDDKTAVSMEDLMTRLTELELKYSTDVPGSAV